MLKNILAAGPGSVNATSEEATMHEGGVRWRDDTTEGAVRWRVTIDGRGAPWLPDALVLIVWARDEGEALVVARAIYARHAEATTEGPAAFLWSGCGQWAASRIEEEIP